ncbi:hypothetical protein PG994_003372 [Apiospora phragmitis]|uniref:Uncharacterized protein n=1 Tax=Apiospora phragmitis TaxID=2905665 RepID=A0ABR1W130_9PEZI
MEYLLRGPGAAFAFVPTIVLPSTFCLAWFAYRPHSHPSRARWERTILFLVGCFSVLAFLLVGCVFFVLALRGEPAWNERLWNWDVLGIILIDSLYVIRAPLSEEAKKHIPTTAYLRNLTDRLWFALCFILFELLFFVLSFHAGCWAQLVALCSHCLWTAVWFWNLKRAGVAVVQLIATVVFGLGQDFFSLLLLAFSSILFVAVEQWSATQRGDTETPYERSGTPRVAGFFATSYPSKPRCVCLIGAGACGKTTLLDSHFLSTDGPEEPRYPTVEDSIYTTCRTEGREERIEVLDTGDWHTYSEVVDQWIKKADVCILPFYNQESFDFIKTSTLPQLSEDDILILFASRNSLNQGREVEDEKASELAREHGWLYRREVDGSPFTQALAALSTRMVSHG